MMTTRILLLGILANLAGAVEIETVPIGNAGNPVESPFGRFGSVPYEYRIGKFEVTNDQYVDFLNAVDPEGTNSLGLYKVGLPFDGPGGIDFDVGAPKGSKYTSKPGRSNNPVNMVNWYDGLRFANWLHNGQGSGETETGAYTLVGSTPIPSNGPNIPRNPDAIWFLPTENEWFKAAYHKNDGVTGNYWDYPTSSDTVPFSDEPPGNDAPDPTNVANYHNHDGLPNGYNDGWAVTGTPILDGSRNYLTDVGAYSQAPSPYGTFDQGGNVEEWLEDGFQGSFRSLRGGDTFLNRMDQLGKRNDFPEDFGSGVGFRVGSIFDLDSVVPGDCNGDGVSDILDQNCIPELEIMFPGDCNSDGVLNIFDADCTAPGELDTLLRDIGSQRGDFDGDGLIQFGDFLILASNFGSSGPYTSGDYDKTGEISFSDFLGFSSAFGRPPPRRSMVLPEPNTSFLVLALGLLCQPSLRRDCRRRL